FTFTHYSRYLLSSDVPAPTDISTLSLHDALPISKGNSSALISDSSMITAACAGFGTWGLPISSHTFKGLQCSWSIRSMYTIRGRSEEHTSELQSRFDLVCRLLLEKKKTILS